MTLLKITSLPLSFVITLLPLLASDFKQPEEKLALNARSQSFAYQGPRSRPALVIDLEQPEEKLALNAENQSVTRQEHSATNSPNRRPNINPPPLAANPESTCREIRKRCIEIREWYQENKNFCCLMTLATTLEIVVALIAFGVIKFPPAAGPGYP